MARTKEQIDHLNQFRDDASKLPYEDEADIQEKQDAIDAQAKIDQEAAELEKLNSEKEQQEKEAKEKKDAEKEKNPPSTKVELTQEEKAEIAKQYFGVTDLSELVKKSEIKKEPTKEELDAAAEKREADKVAYALSKGLITKKAYEEFITDIKDPVSIVYAQFRAEQQAEDKDLTEEDIKSEFESKFGLDTDPETRKYKRGVKEINLLAENIIKAKHTAIFELDGKYAAYESGETSRTATEQKILSEAPVYKKEVEAAYSEIKKVTIPIAENETFDVEIDEKVLNKYKDHMLTNEYSTSQILSGYSKDTIKEVARNAAIIEDLPNILKRYAEEQVKKHQAGTRGILPAKGVSKQVQAKELTEDQKKALNFAFPQEQQIAN